MGSAQLDDRLFEEVAAPAQTRGTGETARDLKSEVAERLRAHRERRARPGSIQAERGNPSPAKHNPIAAAVAERFAQTPSYRAILAEQARLATEEAARNAQKAAAEAEVAARNAHAIAEAQQQLMAELELWDKPQAFTPATAAVLTPQSGSPAAQASLETAQAKAVDPSRVRQGAADGLTVRLYEDLGQARKAVTSMNSEHPTPDRDEVEALDQEIAFRQSPVFEPYEPTVPLPANLLTFPRQLIAPRKARPRVAEGPLLDAEPRNPQLRIFEVEPEQISTAPASESVSPEWANIRLTAQERTPTAEEAHPDLPVVPSYPVAIQAAPLGLRAMAGMVDLCLVGGAFVAFVSVAAKIAHGVPTGIPAAVGSVATLALLYVLFQLLFFTLSDQTPGMRYARIGLCSFRDENPTRAEMRRRVLAQAMAVVPLGLGLMWCLLDDDGLGWHDRLSKMYQRSY